jgi:two-component system, NtrC family, response regulator GlrR
MNDHLPIKGVGLYCLSQVSVQELFLVDSMEVDLIGRSPAFQEMVRIIARMAACDVPVLIEGETGTGKELAARAIHYQSARKDKPFVPVNCGAIPDSLIESELFGYRKGAFTDAKMNQPGLVTLAEGGSLFLDEIEALTPKGQVTLLRFFQDQEFKPLGAHRVEHGDVRILAASNASLPLLTERGSFRADLLYRLRVLCLEPAPLRERKEDVELLAAWFLRSCDQRFGLGAKTLHPESLAWMEQYPWPGNIRELQNLLFREYLLSEGTVIRIAPPKGMGPAPQGSPQPIPGDPFHRAKARAVETFERDYLASLLAHAGGNVSLAARLAGKERRSLGKLLKKYGLGSAPGKDAMGHGDGIPV